MMFEREARLRADVKGERLEFEAKLEAQRQENLLGRQQMERQLREARPQAASEAISEEQLEALQARMVALHASKLLTASTQTIPHRSLISTEISDSLVVTAGR